MPWLANKTATSSTAFTSGLPAAADTLTAAAASWESYWMTGAFIDLASATADPNALELERRVILSRYALGDGCSIGIIEVLSEHRS